MKRFFSILRDVAFVIFVLFICGMIFIMSTGKHFSVAGYQVLRVLTSSMEPAIAENTCIIIKEYPVDQLKVGDIITFTSDDPQIQGYYNTHRIHDIVEENGETLFVTKGDATSAVDAYPVHKDQVAGIFVKELPGGRTLGKMFLALSDNKVYFLVIMLPLALCLLSYFWQIVSMVTGRYDEDEEDEDYEAIKKEIDELYDMGGYPAVETDFNVKETAGKERNFGVEDGSVAEGISDDGETISEVVGTPSKTETASIEGVFGKKDTFGIEGTFDEVGVPSVEEFSSRETAFGVEEDFGMERNDEIESKQQNEKISDNINTIISDSEIEAILAEAASKIEDSETKPEKTRIEKMVEELTSNTVSDELVEKKREMLKAEYKKINKNYAKSDAE
ncbi:MAG: signal peptidase I [Clostridiales bacterium]|nr:signal peptidase I [Clostridiales bacterium]